MKKNLGKSMIECDWCRGQDLGCARCSGKGQIDLPRLSARPSSCLKVKYLIFGLIWFALILIFWIFPLRIILS